MRPSKKQFAGIVAAATLVLYGLSRVRGPGGEDTGSE